MKKYILILCTVITLVTVSAVSSFAQDNNRFSRFMVPVDPVTLKTEGAEVRLWGIQPAQSAETYLELRAIDLMKQRIGTDQVDCKIVSAKNVTAPLARCATASGDDIALMLLQQGLVVRDRRALFGSVFASSYEEAENSAKIGQKGVWALVYESDISVIQNILRDEQRLSLVVFAIVILPILTMLIVAFVVNRAIKKLLRFQTSEANRHQEQEQDLHKREKSLILASLKSELEENKSKVEAFLTVYMQMLSDIKDEEKTPKYQQSGDVVATKPNFVWSAYDANIDKLSALDIQLSAKISDFYKTIHTESEYLDLTTTTPREEAVRTVGQVIQNAQDLLPGFDHNLGLINTQLDHLQS